MRRLIALRLAMSVVSLLLVAGFTFSLIRLSPADPVVLALGEGATAAQKQELRRQLGLDRPLAVQFSSWIGGVLVGDFGQSIFTHRPVSQSISDALPVTLSLVSGGIVLAVVIGITLGFIAGLRPGTWVDRLVTSGVSLALAVPGFWLALLLGLWLAVTWRLFPVAGYTPLSENALHWTQGLVLPCLALSVHGAAVIGRHMRGVVIDVMDSPFVEAIRARGTPRSLIVKRYVLKNALVPLLPVIGIQAAVVLATSPVIEKVFVLPGVGTLMVNAVVSSDFMMLQGTILVFATLLIIVNLLIDIGLGILDPRIRPQ
ncbi:MAG TPA: ABC transporter permease [Pseudolabrys sp.]|nr:ABC transporter permease [Pseudolabrys sp.]